MKPLKENEIDELHDLLDRECDAAIERDRVRTGKRKGGDMNTRIEFDFAKHKVVHTCEDQDFVFFNCCLCGARWERPDRIYVVQGGVALGQCCPDCAYGLRIHKNARTEYWENARWEDWRQAYGPV